MTSTEEKMRELAVQICDDYSWGEREVEDFVRTAEPVQNFIDACREIQKVERDDDYEVPVYELRGTQRHKGEPHKDLIILDCGDFRLVGE